MRFLSESIGENEEKRKKIASSNFNVVESRNLMGVVQLMCHCHRRQRNFLSPFPKAHLLRKEAYRL